MDIHAGFCTTVAGLQIEETMTHKSKNVLVLGGSGFVGSAVARALLTAGWSVTGLSRSTLRMEARLPEVRWISCDVGRLSPDRWKDLLREQSVVVNCAGALQDGASDDVAATQERAMTAMYAAAADLGGRLVVQVSARTAGAAADTAFLSTKRLADEALASSGLPFVILRPALVVGRNAHGGTALLRALAALSVSALFHADSEVRTVSLDSVAQVVVEAAEGQLPPGSDFELASDERMTLRDLVAAHRAWLGLPPARTVRVPAFLAATVSRLADLAGRFGWRSPLRSTAMKVMSEGVVSAAPGLPVEGASHALRNAPSGVQDIWAARLYLMKPLVLVSLSAFWIASGLVPLVDPERAASHFLPFMGASAAWALTLITCAIDVALGTFVLYRRYARTALFGMLAVSAAYLGGATVLEPELRFDPLGPLVKVVPSMILTLVAIAIMDER